MSFRNARRRRSLLPAVLAAAASVVLAATALAAAPMVNTGAAIAVDGSFADWTDADFFANMYRAGKTDKEVESKLFLRYDCTAGILYVSVVAEDGVTIIDSEADNFVKFGESDKKVDGADSPPDGTQPNFAYAAEGAGWEASFSIGEVSITDLNVHAQVEHDGSQTSAVADRAIPMAIECEGDEEGLTPTLTLDKITVNGDDSFAFTATGGFNQSLTGAATPVLVASTSGSFTITEVISTAQADNGWAFTSVECTGNASDETKGNETVTVTVGANEDVTCTFTNMRTSSGTLGGNPTPAPTGQVLASAPTPTPAGGTLPDTAMGQFGQLPATVLSIVLLAALAATVYLRVATQRR